MILSLTSECHESIKWLPKLAGLIAFGFLHLDGMLLKKYLGNSNEVMVRCVVRHCGVCRHPSQTEFERLVQNYVSVSAVNSSIVWEMFKKQKGKSKEWRLYRMLLAYILTSPQNRFVNKYCSGCQGFQGYRVVNSWMSILQRQFFDISEGLFEDKGKLLKERWPWFSTKTWFLFQYFFQRGLSLLTQANVSINSLQYR